MHLNLKEKANRTLLNAIGNALTSSGEILHTVPLSKITYIMSYVISFLNIFQDVGDVDRKAKEPLQSDDL